MTFISFGGVEQVCNLNFMKGSSNDRIDYVRRFLDKVSSAALRQRIDPPEVVAQKQIPTTHWEQLTAEVEIPVSRITHCAISAVPPLQHFIFDTDEWVHEMASRLERGARIAKPWDWITNILDFDDEDKDTRDPVTLEGDPPNRKGEYSPEACTSRVNLANLAGM